MLLRHHQLLITPTRRVGGTSVTQAVAPYFSSPADAERFNLGVLSGSEYGRNYPLHGDWLSEVTNGPFRTFHKVLMIRNPFEKLVSGYKALVALNRMPLKSFRDFVLQREALAPHSGDIWAWDHTWRTLADISLVNGVFAFDDIIRFERLESDFKRVCSHVGLPNLSLPHARATAHGDYSSFYDVDTQSAVAAHFAEDLRLFDYAFSPPA